VEFVKTGLQIVLGAALGVLILATAGGTFRYFDVRVESAQAGPSLATRSQSPAPESPGREELVAAIEQSTRGAAAPAVANHIGAMTNGPAGFDPSDVRTLRDGFYGAVRSDGAPCFYVQLADKGGDGFCLRSFLGQLIVTSPVVVRQYDSATAPFDMFVSGLARPSVRKVTFATIDGRTFSDQVVSGTFSVHLPSTEPGQVQAITVTLGSGAMRELTPLAEYIPVRARQ
jgi:hypothetical protein